MLPDAKARGFRPGRFSFNVKGGRCEACQGDGVIAIEMHFLPNVYVTCEQCKGRRYNRETLEIKYRGKSIADVLDLTVDQALPLLENFPPIANKLRTLQDVGLGYIELGQSATTLSGGEAQRVKLSKELSRRGTGRTLYILDEPTTGLHFEDTHKLLDVLNKLVDQGNTVVIIEHNLDVIKSADHVIDLGPEGGAGRRADRRCRALLKRWQGAENPLRADSWRTFSARRANAGSVLTCSPTGRSGCAVVNLTQLARFCTVAERATMVPHRRPVVVSSESPQRRCISESLRMITARPRRDGRRLCSAEWRLCPSN